MLLQSPLVLVPVLALWALERSELLLLDGQKVPHVELWHDFWLKI